MHTFATRWISLPPAEECCAGCHEAVHCTALPNTQHRTSGRPAHIVHSLHSLTQHTTWDKWKACTHCTLIAQPYPIHNMGQVEGLHTLYTHCTALPTTQHGTSRRPAHIVHSLHSLTQHTTWDKWKACTHCTLITHLCTSASSWQGALLQFGRRRNTT